MNAAPDGTRTLPAPQPFIKWAGGKGRLLTHYRRFFPPHYGHYYEPFIGSGAVFLALQPAAATLNDRNPALIAAYRHIRDDLAALLPLLERLRAHYANTPPDARAPLYYQWREQYNHLPTGDLHKTALLLVLNKTCYNGLYRENRRGGFNVPFGRYANPQMFSPANLHAVAHALRGTTLHSNDFATVVQAAQPGDFVYCDPPYVPVSASASFTAYTRETFGLAEQQRLAATARDLARRGVQVMLSNADVPLVYELYAGFRIARVQASRAINSNAARRGKVSEVVMTSYPPAPGSSLAG